MIRLDLLALGIAAAVLTATISAEWHGDEIAQGADTAPAFVSSSREPGMVAAVDRIDAWLADSLARPLFTANRRPVSRQPGTTAVRSDGLPRLAGILAGPFGRHAIFSPEGGGKSAIVEVGATLGEFLVQDIDDDGVTLLKGNSTERVRLRYEPAQGKTPSAPASPFIALPEETQRVFPTGRQP